MEAGGPCQMISRSVAQIATASMRTSTSARFGTGTGFSVSDSYPGSPSTQAFIRSGIGQFGAIQAVAPSLGMELSPVDVRDASGIERGVTAFARKSNGGLIVTGTALAFVHRDLIISLANQHRLPSVYWHRRFVPSGGLGSYGPDTIDPFRRAAGYVDRILKGEKPADLPVQAPTKYELVINLKTAKALGLDVPQSLLARADEVIE